MKNSWESVVTNQLGPVDELEKKKRRELGG